MSILLHVCCGPCLLYPAKVLEGEGTEFTCYFFNPNIHPYREFKKRLDSFRELAEARRYPVVIDPDYGLRAFLRTVVFHEEKRCSSCYAMRLEKTARMAREGGYTAFSTTLLYSTYQNHALIRARAAEASAAHQLPFFYDDFRVGWQQGIDEARNSSLYLQKYCGCIYSEQERYDNRLKKKLNKIRKDNVQSSRSGHNQPE